MAAYTLDTAFLGQPFVQIGTNLGTLDVAFLGQPFAMPLVTGVTTNLTISASVGALGSIGTALYVPTTFPSSETGQVGVTLRIVKQVGKIMKAR